MNTLHGCLPPTQLQLSKQCRDKYKRSTNNSHKKFICVARKLLYKYVREGERELFQREYEAHQNSRVFYFIILAHAKLRLSGCEGQNFKRNLITLLNAKIHTYRQEIGNSHNRNFINFRFEEIADIEFAINALHLYFQNRVPQAIEAIYKKEKGLVLKRQQYQTAIDTINQLEGKLSCYPRGELFPYINQKPREAESMGKCQNRCKSKRKQDEQWVLDRHYKGYSSKKQGSRDGEGISKNEAVVQSADMPLLYLQNSYKYQPHFFSILFNYEPYFFNPYSSIACPQPNNPFGEQQKHIYNQSNLLQTQKCRGYNNDMEGDMGVKRQERGYDLLKREFKEYGLVPPQSTNESMSNQLI